MHEHRQQKYNISQCHRRLASFLTCKRTSLVFYVYCLPTTMHYDKRVELRVQRKMPPSSLSRWPETGLEDILQTTHSRYVLRTQMHSSGK